MSPAIDSTDSRFASTALLGRLPPTLVILSLAWLAGLVASCWLVGPGATDRLANVPPVEPLSSELGVLPLGPPLAAPGPRVRLLAWLALGIAGGFTAFRALAGRGGHREAIRGPTDCRRLWMTAAWWCVAGFLHYQAAQPHLDSAHIARHNGERLEFVGQIVAEPDRRDQRIGYRVAAALVSDGAKPPYIAPPRERAAGSAAGASACASRRPVARLPEGVLRQLGQVHCAHGVVLVWGPVEPAFEYGQWVRVRGRLEAPQKVETFDYPRFLARQGIFAVVRRAEVAQLPGRGGNPVQRVLLWTKAAARRSLGRSLPHPESALATGILLGDDKGIPEQTAEAFRRTNTSHVIAISGSNVSLLVAALSFALAGRLSQRRSLPLILAVLALYAVLVGADPAVVRATLMGSLMIVAGVLGRRGDALVGLFAAAWAMTLYRPLYIEDLGFQLSFAATWGLIALVPRLEALFDPLLAALEQRATWRCPLGHWLGEAAVTSLAAQLATWPILAHQVGQLSVAGLLANLLIVPVQPLVMALGGLTIVAGLLSPLAGRLVGSAAWLPLAFTIRTVEAAARLPLATVALRFSASAVAFYYALLTIVLAIDTRHGRWPDLLKPGGKSLARVAVAHQRRTNGALAGLCAVNLLVWTAVFRQPDGLLHVHMLDVGQGDAILVVAPSGQRMLVDGGPAASVVLDRLGRILAPWERRLDVVVLTHPDGDHLGGLPAVLDRYEVAHVLEPFATSNTPFEAQWQDALERESAQRHRAAVGTRWLLDEHAGVQVEVLWPPADARLANDDGTNARSTVLRVTYGRTAVLLTGDLEADGEARLLARGAELRANVLKVAHHGSASSTTAPFLAQVAPQVALIGVGAENRFGHPSGEVLDRLAHTCVLRTDEQGDVEILLDGQSVWLRRGRCR